MDEATLELDLGRVWSRSGELHCCFRLRDNGDATIHVYAHESGSRRAGTLLMLDAAGFEQLKAVVAKADDAIARMQQDGKLKRLALPW